MVRSGLAGSPVVAIGRTVAFSQDGRLYRRKRQAAIMDEAAFEPPRASRTHGRGRQACGTSTRFQHRMGYEARRFFEAWYRSSRSARLPGSCRPSREPWPPQLRPQAPPPLLQRARSEPPPSHPKDYHRRKENSHSQTRPSPPRGRPGHGTSSRCRSRSHARACTSSWALRSSCPSGRVQPFAPKRRRLL